jgi:hypothetical protein
MSQEYISKTGPLLNSDGSLAAVGWSRQPVLDSNLENTNIYKTFKFWQPMRIKVWDYYAITTPTHFFSFTISDVGYIGSIFAYVIDFQTNEYHEETLTVPLAKGVSLPCSSESGESTFTNGKVSLHFSVNGNERKISVHWPDFHHGDLNAELTCFQPQEHESMMIVIPIKGNRYYYNRKLNCMPTSGWVEYEGNKFDMDPQRCLANLDWGRGVWEYNSFWVWSSASGFLNDGRRIGLNFGYGFGDNSHATENCVILEGKVHKLEQVDYTYSSQNFKAPWTMKSTDGRLDLVFTPFFERAAKTDMLILKSEVHQMFGHYNGTAVLDSGEKIEIKNLIGWSEEHNAKW